MGTGTLDNTVTNRDIDRSRLQQNSSQTQDYDFTQFYKLTYEFDRISYEQQ